MIAGVPISVLIIDDDPGFRVLARRAIAGTGMSVIGEAGTALAGAMAARDMKPDVMLVDVGPLSTHMLHHIAIMNVLAPLFALAIATRAGALLSRAPRARHLWFAAGLQLLVLVAWHLPVGPWVRAWGCWTARRRLASSTAPGLPR